jgi:cardiolipin synthase
LMAQLLRSRSTVGQLLDPIADKALFLSALLTLMLSGDIRWWQAGLVLLRDFVVFAAVIITAVRSLWRDFTRMKPTVLGKITTVFVFIWLVAVLAPWEWTHALRPGSFVAASASSAIAAIDYFRRMVPELRTPREPS